MGAYQRQVRAFRRKFGREMGPEDPFFFDPAASTPAFRSPQETQYAMNVLAELMAEAGLDPATIYAFKATRGLFPDAAAPFSPDQEAEWNAALQDYYSKLRRIPTQ